MPRSDGGQRFVPANRRPTGIAGKLDLLYALKTCYQ
jgi:hypothetical protein